MSILVVDDSQDARNVMASILKGSGYEDVAMADSAEEAYGMLGMKAQGTAHRVRSPVELILMDIDMPHTDGLEACRRIKEDDRLRDVPVIFVTGQTDARSMRAAFSAGAADFISKPIRKADLIASMGSLLGDRKNPAPDAH